MFKWIVIIGSMCLFSALGYYTLNTSISSHNICNNSRCIDLEEFNSIQMDIDAANVNIQESDKFKIEYNLSFSSPSDNIICKNEEGALIFKSPKNSRVVNNKDQYINIFVSPYKKLNDCTINMNVGNFSCSDKILMGDNLKIKCNTGNINILNCDSENINIESNVGEIGISGNIYGDSVISLKTGNVALNLLKPLQEYSYSLKSNLGNIISYGKKSKSDNLVGAILESDNFDGSKLDVHVNTGNIDINKLRI